jgi:outer membrane protein
MAKGSDMSDRLRHGARVAFLLSLVLSAVPSSFAQTATETITLGQALQGALQGGLDAKIADLILEAARAQYDQAVAQSSTSLTGTVGAGYSLAKDDSLTAGVAFALPRTMTSADVSASYGIVRNDPGVSFSVGQTIWDGYGSPLDGGKGAASLKQSALTLRAKELAGESSRQGVIARIKQAYFAVLAAQHTLAARREALGQQQAQRERTKARADARLATSLDLRQAEINVRSAELDLAAAETALAASRRTLSLAAGWPGERVYTVAEAPDPVAPELDIPTLVATAMKNRVDVRQQALNAQSAAITLALRKSAKSPIVSMNGSVSLDTWSIGVEGKIPLVDSGLAAAQVRETTIAKEQARREAEQLAETVDTEVTTAVTDLKDLVARVDLATARRDLASAQYELAQTRQSLGVGSTLDVLDALVSLTQADVSLSKAKSDVYLGILRLQDAIGTIEE